jgi:hypothetical protein
LPRTAFVHNPQLPLPGLPAENALFALAPHVPRPARATVQNLRRCRHKPRQPRGDRRISMRRRSPGFRIRGHRSAVTAAAQEAHNGPAAASHGAIAAPAHELARSDILAAHLETAITRIDALDSCVDLLARHFAGALDRIELLESRLWHRSDGAATREDANPAPLSDASRSATLQYTPPAIEHARVRPTLTLLPDLRDPRAAAAAVAASPTTPTTPGRSERFSDMSTFLHAVVSAQRRTATR